MTTFNTGNPVPSTAVKDLYDNSQTEDEFVNSDAHVTITRTGKSVKTMAGMNFDVADAISNVAYSFIGDYAAGLTVGNYNQIFRYSGEFYKALPTTSLPYTMTGVPATDLPLFTSVGDAALRTELATPTGAGLVGFDSTQTYPAGSVGAFLKTLASGDEINLFQFGGIAGDPTKGLVNINAMNAMYLAASALGTADQPMRAVVPRSTLGPFWFDGQYTGTNKSMVQPQPYVELVIRGGMKVGNGANAAAGTTGWNWIHKAEDTDPATDYSTVVFDGGYMDGNAANNLNTIMKRNAFIGFLKGVGCGVYTTGKRKGLMRNAPGWSVVRFGLDVFPFSVGPATITDIDFRDVGETIVGNTGITDHSSVYGFTSLRAERCSLVNTGLPATICSMFEAHGSNSVINDNYYDNALNIVNIGGYASSASGFRVTNNIGLNGHMLIRGFTNPSFTIDTILLQGNRLKTSVGYTAFVDFGVATAYAGVDNLVSIGNTFEFSGADHGIGYPPGYWIANVKNFYSSGNTFINTLGPVYTFGNAPAGCHWVIDGDRLENPNFSNYAASYAAAYIDNNVGKFGLVEMKNCTITGGKSYAMATGAFAAVDGDLLNFHDNTVTDLPNLINIEGTAGIDLVSFRHIGRAPTQAFEVGNQWNKFSVNSSWECIDKDYVMRKTVFGSTYWTKDISSGVTPTVGLFQKGDSNKYTLPNAGGPSRSRCTTGGLNGAAIWKDEGALAA